MQNTVIQELKCKRDNSKHKKPPVINGNIYDTKVKVTTRNISDFNITESYDGWFMKWGLEAEEMNDGNITYTVGIVLLDDGTIRTPLPHQIAFER